MWPTSRALAKTDPWFCAKDYTIIVVCLRTFGIFSITMVPKKQESSLDRAIRSLREDDFRVFPRRAWVFFRWRIIDFLVLYPYARWKLSREALKVQTPEAAVKFAFDRFGHLMRPMQYKWEITELVKLYREHETPRRA